MSALTAELTLVRHRPAPYALAGVWSLMLVAFAFVVPYIVYLNLDPVADPERGELLAVTLPASMSTTAISSYPLFGGPMMLILGVLLTGAESRWGTWKVRLTQGPSRSQVVVAKMVSGSLAAAGVVLVAHVAAALASWVIAVVSGGSTAAPGIVDVLRSVGIALVLGVVWTVVGMALGIVVQSGSLAIAGGLMWTLAIENMLVGLATMIPALEPVRQVLLGAASGSLVAAAGAPTQGAGGGTPGVVDVLSGPGALLVLAAYVAVAVAASVWTVRRRDVS